MYIPSSLLINGSGYIMHDESQDLAFCYVCLCYCHENSKIMAILIYTAFIKCGFCNCRARGIVIIIGKCSHVQPHTTWMALPSHPAV